MRIGNGESVISVPEAETIDKATAAFPSSAVRQAALKQAGLGGNSAFKQTARPQPASVMVVGPTALGATVTAGQLQNGTASLPDPVVAAGPAPKYVLSSDPGDLNGQLAVLAGAGSQDFAGSYMGIMARDAAPAASKQVIIDTVLAALKPEDRGAAQSLISGSVTDESLARAFAAVMNARSTPGQQAINVSLTPLITTNQWEGGGEGGSMVVHVDPGAPVSFSNSITVSTGGLVNGATLPADKWVEIQSAVKAVPAEFLMQTLREAGVNDYWLAIATPEQQRYAYFKIAEARQTPGKHTVDLSFSYTMAGTSGGDSDHDVINTIAASCVLALDVDAAGNVNGQQLSDAKALKAVQVVDQMTPETKQGSLVQLGFTNEAVQQSSEDQMRYALIKVMVTMLGNAGTSQFECQMGPDKYAVGLKIDENHRVIGAGVQKVPPPPKKSWWSTVVSVVCAVVAIVFPVVAPICMAINAASAIASGAKGLALIGAIAGGAAGFAGIADMAGVAGAAATASTFSNVATGINALNSVSQGFQNGDFLGALAGAVTAGSSGLFGSTISDGLNNLGNSVSQGLGAATNGLLGGTGAGLSSLAKAAGGVGSLIRGDIAGGLTQLGGAAGQAGLIDQGLAQNINTAGQVIKAGQALENGNIAGALTAGIGAANAQGYLDDQTARTTATVVKAVNALAKGNAASALSGVFEMARSTNLQRFSYDQRRLSDQRLADQRAVEAVNHRRVFKRGDAPA